MKFKDRDRNVFEDMRDAINSFCKNMTCGDCPVQAATYHPCLRFIDAHPAEAARLMGYEVVEDWGGFMRLIDADAMEKDLREQFERVFTLAGRKVKPEDYYIERRETYLTDVRKAEYDSFFEYLKTRPTITPESLVKRGRWIWADDGYLRCSNCTQKAPVVRQWDDEPITTATFYCPYCGCKMVED